jgi:hypothetical protein
VGKGKTRGMWVDQYRPRKFSDLLGEDVSLLLCCHRFRRETKRLMMVIEGSSGSYELAQGMG